MGIFEVTNFLAYKCKFYLVAVRVCSEASFCISGRGFKDFNISFKGKIQIAHLFLKIFK